MPPKLDARLIDCPWGTDCACWTGVGEQPDDCPLRQPVTRWLNRGDVQAAAFVVCCVLISAAIVAPAMWRALAEGAFR